MNLFRTLLTGMVLAVLSSVTHAQPSKIFSINVSPFGTSPVAVTIKNETPNGNSTINSFVITAPPGVTISLASPASSASASVQLTGNQVYVNNFTGLQAGTKTPKTLTIYLNASYGATNCGAQFTWSAIASAGNAFSQDFSLVTGSPPTNPTQSVPGCNYSVTGLPSTLPAGATSVVNATVKNETAAGGPTLTSVSLTGPTGVTVSPSSTTVSLAPGASQVINVSVATTCGAADGAWGSTASGASGSFTRIGGALPNLAVTPECALKFLQSPQNVVSGSPFDVKVGATDGTNTAIGSFTGPVTFQLTGPGTLTTGSSSSSGGVVTQSLTINPTGAGAFTLTAQSIFGSANLVLTSQAFGVFDAQIKCENGTETLPFTFGDGTAGGQRGASNKDGSPCIPVAYTFSNNVSTSNSIRLQWDTGTQPTAAFEEVVNWQPELVASDGLPAKTTYVAWTFDGNGNPTNKQAGRACIDSVLPTRYGTLTTSTSSPDTITIDTTGGRALPGAYPFAIFIGGPKLNDPGNTYVVERLNVTGASGNVLSVQRGQGGSNQVNLAAVAGTAKIMSNPLPLDGSGNQMQMCIAQETWTSLKPGTAGCPAIPAGNPPTACIQYNSVIFDIGDGFVSRDF